MRLSPLGNVFSRRLRLERGRIYLRALRQGDWREWAELREESRSFLVPWEPTWAHDSLSRAAFRRRVRAYDREWQQGTAYSFLVLRQEDDAILGGATLSHLRRGVAQSASLGYWVGSPHARQGYMTEALGAVLDFSFDDLSLHRVEAACLPENKPSRALLTRCGFQEEGHAREYLRINGRWQDHVLYAILRQEWREAARDN